MQNQDWEEVVIHGKRPVISDKKPVSRPTPDKKFLKLDSDQEEFKHEKVSVSLKKQIQQSRMAKGWSQVQFAQQLNLKPDVIREYENGKAIPDNNILNKMRQKLGVKLTK